MKFVFGGRTDTGKVRQRNEDSLLIEPDIGLCIVADGMGGYGGGDIASGLACSVMSGMVKDSFDTVRAFEAAGSGFEWLNARAAVMDLLKRGVSSADSEIRKTAAERANDSVEDLTGMGSTIVVALFVGNRVFIAHVGDSRAYLIRHNSAFRLTNDHSLVQGLVGGGLISSADAVRFPMKNVLTRALGAPGSSSPDVMDVELLDGDRIVLGSDGLYGLVRDEMIARLAVSGDVDRCAEKLVAYANAAGGHDNVSVLIADCRQVDSDDETTCSESDKHGSMAMSLRERSVFRGLMLGEWLQLYSDSARLAFADGETVFSTGEPADRMYCVLEGQIDVVRNGRASLSFPAGTCLGEMSLLEEKVRLVSAVACGPTTVLTISRSDFLALCDRNPVAACRILRQLGIATASKLRDTRDELSILKTFVSKKFSGN